MTDYAHARARNRITWLAGQGLDLVSFWREASVALTPVVPHLLSPCWYTLDPASLLVTSHYNPDMPPLPAAWLAHEYLEDDFHGIDVCPPLAGHPGARRRHWPTAHARVESE